MHAGHMAEVLERFGDQLILLHIDAPIRRFRFDRREQSIIDVLRAKPQPLNELLARGLAEAEYVRRLVYAMLITRQLESGIPGVEPIGVDEAASSSRMPVAPALPLPPKASRHPSPAASSAPTAGKSPPRSPSTARSSPRSRSRFVSVPRTAPLTTTSCWASRKMPSRR